jgi:hypothetical protein
VIRRRKRSRSNIYIDMALGIGSSIHREEKLVIYLHCKSKLSEIEQVDCSSNGNEVGNRKDFQKLQEDVEELKDLLKTATCASVKEVILYEIKVILCKINNLIDIHKRKIGSDKCWTGVRRANAFTNKNKQNQIPVISNL